jgi:hypothetical protein
MADIDWDDDILENEEFSEFSEYEIKQSNKKRNRNESKMLKKQRNFKKEALGAENYTSFT